MAIRLNEEIGGKVLAVHVGGTPDSNKIELDV